MISLPGQLAAALRRSDACQTQYATAKVGTSGSCVRDCWHPSAACVARGA